jgi:hypothetical protein
MPRRPHPDLIKPWKISMQATVAGKTEHLLWDTINKKPHYGARGALIHSLLNWWLARESGIPADQLPHIPTALELLSGAYEDA